MPQYVDAHCHLDYRDDLSAAAQVCNARAGGVTTLVTVGTDMASSTQAVSTARRHDGVWAAVGVHPNDAMEATPRVLEVIDELAADPVVVAIGETGLDYYRDHTTPAQQEASFRAHIAIAKQHGKTLMIHCRDAWDDCLAVLADAGPPERVVMHCYSGDLAVTERCAAAGWFMSFAGNVTFKTAGSLRRAAAAAPLELLLTETDSPFLSPHPHRGQPNEPARVPFVVRALSEVTSVPVDELAATVRRNAERAFSLCQTASPATSP